MMSWSTVQQLIRIVGYSAGSYFLGESIASGEMYQAALSGAVSIAAFVWWMVAESKKA